jgi:hypothetical protein
LFSGVGATEQSPVLPHYGVVVSPPRTLFNGDVAAARFCVSIAHGSATKSRPPAEQFLQS